MVDLNLSEQQSTIYQLASDFSRQEIMPVAGELDRTMEFPWEVVRKAHANGLMNLSAPEEVGGANLSKFEQCLVIEQLGYGCSGVATAMSNNDLSLGPLVRAGNKEQWQEFIKPLLDEPKIASYCVTEPGAGSDVAAIKTTAKKDGDHYVLNGEKMWITGGGVASWYYVLATMDPAGGYNAMTAFVVPRDVAGIEPGKKEINMGQRCSDTRAIKFTNVRIPERFRLGQEGEGFKIAMKVFDGARPTVAAMSVGVAQRCLDLALQYAQERKAFGKPIAKHQAVSFMLADMAKDIEAARLLTWKAALLHDQGEKNTKYASMAKCLSGDIAMASADKALQIFGGYGFNTEYPIEKIFRDAKILQIYEGTQQIQRLIISRELLSEA